MMVSKLFASLIKDLAEGSEVITPGGTTIRIHLGELQVKWPNVENFEIWDNQTFTFYEGNYQVIKEQLTSELKPLKVTHSPLTGKATFAYTRGDVTLYSHLDKDKIFDAHDFAYTRNKNFDLTIQ